MKAITIIVPRTMTTIAPTGNEEDELDNDPMPAPTVVPVELEEVESEDAEEELA
jgi:hypothetical protein